jgi:hypothetical protein
VNDPLAVDNRGLANGLRDGDGLGRFEVLDDPFGVGAERGLEDEEREKGEVMLW